MQAIKFFRRIGEKVKRFLFLLIERSAIYPVAIDLEFPFKEWEVNGSGFGQEEEIDGEYLGFHLGEDCKAPGKIVNSIGEGFVIYQEIRLGSIDEKSGKKKRDWGGIVMVGHNSNGDKFISIYGHLDEILVKNGQRVNKGTELGRIAKADSPENGYWETSHLHFAIFTGKWWDGIVLPGYWKKDMRGGWLCRRINRPENWTSPTEFINSHRLIISKDEQK